MAFAKTTMMQSNNGDTESRNTLLRVVRKYRGDVTGRLFPGPVPSSDDDDLPEATMFLT